MKGILLDSHGEIDIVKGGMTVGDVRHQTAGFLLHAMRGEFREYPLLGLEAKTMLGGIRDPFFRTRAKKMLRHAKIEIRDITFSGNDIILK